MKNIKIEYCRSAAANPQTDSLRDDASHSLGKLRSALKNQLIQVVPGNACPDRILRGKMQPGKMHRVKLHLRNTGMAKMLLAGVALVLLSGCESINYKRITYDFLRQEDCRRNDVDVYEFCSRTFVFEYDEYEQLRQEYIRSEQDKIMRDQKARERLYTVHNSH